MEIELSIIIINWNTADLLYKCLTSIYKYTENVNFEIIVFDNASSDHSEQILSQFSNIKIIYHHENIGFARANNKAVDYANGKYILFLNPDTELIENTLLKVLTFIKRSDFDIAGVRLRLPDNKIQVSSGNFPTIKTMIFQNIYLTLNRLKLSFLIPVISRLSNVPVSQLLQNNKLWDPYINHKVDWVSGAFFLLLKDDFINISKFRVEYFFGGEEIDLAYRLSQHGKQVYFYGLTEIIHHSGASLKNFQEKSFILHHLAGLRLYTLNRPKWESIMYRLIIILSFSSMAVVLKVKSRFVSQNNSKKINSKIYAYYKVISYYIKNKLTE